MSEQNTAAGSSDSSSTTSTFAEELGEFFGDYSTVGESPESDDSAAGSTPAEHATDSATEPKTPDAATAKTPESEGTTPDAPTTPVEEDYLKDTTPATYVVNGQSRSIDDIRVFKEGGAVIPHENLPNVLAKLADRDQLESKYQARDRDYTTLAKVTEWTGPDNQTITGPEAAIQNRIANASLFAENALMLPVFTSEDLQPFITVKVSYDAQGNKVEKVVFRPDFVQSLSEKAKFQRDQIEFETKRHYAGVMAEASKPQAQPINFDTEAPRLITAIATDAKLDASVLTAADKALLAKQLPANIQNGLASIAWQELVKDRIQLRTEQKASTQKLVQTTTDATKTGLANMAAAARGVKQRPTTPSAPAKPISPAVLRQQTQGDAYDQMERAAAKAVRSTA